MKKKEQKSKKNISKINYRENLVGLNAGKMKKKGRIMDKEKKAMEGDAQDNGKNLIMEMEWGQSSKKMTDREKKIKVGKVKCRHKAGLDYLLSLPTA